MPWRNRCPTLVTTRRTSRRRRNKVAFSNEVDFVGDTVASLDSPSFSVYTVGENGKGNLPNIP